jgi:hypothetical protein
VLLLFHLWEYWVCVGAAIQLPGLAADKISASSTESSIKFMALGLLSQQLYAICQQLSSCCGLVQ